MRASEYTRWLERAFSYCEAALLEEIATPSRLCITEELLRSALVRGLAHSKPDEAKRLRTEARAAYSSHDCWSGCAARPIGRPIQYDIMVAGGNDSAGHSDNGALVEVKWLKQPKPAELLRDVWKLAFGRAEAPHKRACRTYLLVGGNATAFASTLKTVRTAGVDLRWSDAGRQAGPPARKRIAFDTVWREDSGWAAFQDLLRWGREGHIRRPPDCWADMLITRRCAWLKTIPSETGRSTSWRLALWELHTHGVGRLTGIDWANTMQDAGMKCAK